MVPPADPCCDVARSQPAAGHRFRWHHDVGALRGADHRDGARPRQLLPAWPGVLHRRAGARRREVRRFTLNPKPRTPVRAAVASGRAHCRSCPKRRPNLGRLTWRPRLHINLKRHDCLDSTGFLTMSSARKAGSRASWAAYRLHRLFLCTHSGKGRAHADRCLLASEARLPQSLPQLTAYR